MATRPTYEELEQRIKVLEGESARLKQAEEELRQSEERYRLVAENVSDVLWIRDMNLAFTYISSSVEKLTGYRVEEAMALPMEKAYTPASIGTALKALEEELALEKDESSNPSRVRNLELEGYHKNGARIWAESKMTFLRDSTGRVSAILGVSRDITERRKGEALLQERQRQLDIKSKNLEEMNTALKVLMKKRAEDQEEFQERVLMNLKELVEPYLEKLGKSQLDELQKSHLEILESNLKDIVSSFSRKLSSLQYGLTPTEIRVANLVREGRKTKDIAEILNSTVRAVEFHRQSLRKKLGLQKMKSNLQSHLLARF
jgi:PAS domain S-box-containing protein